MTTLTPFLTACPPRPISQAADQYAAELIGGIREDLATPEKAADFLKTTHLTSTTRNLLRMVMDRMENGASSTSPSIFQLYSRYGGGKTPWDAGHGRSSITPTSRLLEGHRSD